MVVIVKDNFGAIISKKYHQLKLLVSCEVNDKKKFY